MTLDAAGDTAPGEPTMDINGGRMEVVLAQALASVDAASASASGGDIDATLDDLLAARLLLTSLIQALEPPTIGTVVG